MKRFFHCIIILGVLSLVIAACQPEHTNSDWIRMANDKTPNIIMQ